METASRNSTGRRYNSRGGSRNRRRSGGSSRNHQPRHHDNHEYVPDKPHEPIDVDSRDVWDQIEDNVQRVAVEHELVTADERFTLTEGQEGAIDALGDMLAAGKRRVLLVAPTGAGKTEVLMRLGVESFLATRRCTIVIVPTRDLSRQHFQYMSERLEGTRLPVCELHGGVPPSKRRRDLHGAIRGTVAFAIGSSMILHSKHYKELLEEAGLIVIDDVNAFDEAQDLSHLRGLRTPCMFTTATPNAVRNFLRNEGALDNKYEMKTMPFDSPATEIHKLEAGFGENVYTQLDRAMEQIERHLELKSRIYVISKTRVKVPTMTLYLEDKLGIPVAMLHGEMADTKEHSQRQSRQKSVWAKVPETRTEMMKRFKHNTPSILCATNLVGSGLDVPMADLIVITDADHFSESEIEQLIGRVGRRARASDAVLITGTVVNRENTGMRTKSTVRNGRVVMTFGTVRGRRGRR